MTIVTIVTFFGLLVFAAIVALMLVPPLMADMKLLPEAAAALRSSASAGASGAMSQVAQLPGFAAWVTGLIPANVIKAAADGAMLPLIVFAFVFALAARHIEAPLRQALVDFFGADRRRDDTIGRVDHRRRADRRVRAGARCGEQGRVGTRRRDGVLHHRDVAVLVLFTLLMYPVATIRGRVPMGAFTRGVLPAQAVALSSSSSLASLPALVEGSRRSDCPRQVSGFVLPLAVSTFKVATPITWLVGIAFLARLYGVTLSTCRRWWRSRSPAVALSLTLPGRSAGCRAADRAACSSTYGIPAEGVALLIAADTIPDLFGTMTNVTADLVAGAVVGRQAVAESVPEAALSPNA